MQMPQVGVDVIEVERIREAVERFGERFLKRVFTSVELDYCFRMKDPYVHLAGRFCAKEAFAKALRTGIGRGVTWRQIEVRNEPSGAPYYALYGKARELLGRRNALLSISHTRQVAVAVCVLLETGGVP